jgi:hypothetical protein
MRTPVSPTYLLPDDAVVEGGPWLDANGDEVGDRIDHWDPVTDLMLSRALVVDVDAVRDQCGLGPDASLAVVTSWRSPRRTRLGHSSQPVELGALSGLLNVPVTLSAKGPETGGRIDLTTRLVLRSPGAEASPISPKRNGTILWTETQRVTLEGSAARFPVTAVDFTDLVRVPDGAAWFVEWDPRDLDAPVLGGLRLLINSAHPRIVNSVRTASDDPAAVVVRSLMMGDVARHLVRAALDDDDFVSQPDGYTEESVGRLLADLIATIWPGVPIGSVRTRAANEPARVEAEIQAALEVAR